MRSLLRHIATLLACYRIMYRNVFILFSTWLFFFSWVPNKYLYAQVIMVALESEQRESLIKSAYILNFTKYVTWPEEYVTNTSDSQRLCMISNENFVAIVKKMASGKTFQGKRLDVVTEQDPTKCKQCSLIYIQSLDSSFVEASLKSFPQQGVLTIGESEHFLESGGMIRIFIVNNTVQFEVNIRAMEAAGFLVSSNMLRVAWRTVK